MQLRKVRIIQGLAGKDSTLNAGDLQDLPEATALRYVSKGVAEYVGKGEGDEPSPPAKRARKAKSSKVTQKR